LPEDSDGKQVELSSSYLAALLGGFDLQRATRRRWYAHTS
jgi:hypothetical protein